VKLILDGTTGNRGGGLDGFSLGCLPPFPVSLSKRNHVPFNEMVGRLLSQRLGIV